MAWAAAILSGWAPAEDWKVVDGSPESTGKALQAVSSLLLKKAAQTSFCGVDFPTALKVNMDSTLRDAVLECNVQRHLEELDQHTLALEQEPHGPEEPSVSDSKAVRDDDDECYETEGLHLAVRPIVQQQ